MITERRTPGQLLRDLYESLSQGDSEPLANALADDVTWRIIGSTPLSGTYRGKAEVLSGLFGGLRDRLATPTKLDIERVLEDGDYAVLFATGDATAVTGRRYNNSYAILAHVVDGRLVEMTDYVDTDLMLRSLWDDH